MANGIYVAWIDHRNFQNEVFFSKLSQNGSTFSANKPLTGINDSKSFPQIEEDNGKIYISWGESRVVNGVTRQAIFFTKSLDQGQTFSEEQLIDDNEGLPISMVAHDSKIFIAYSKGGNEIWVAFSNDSGTTFTKTKVSDTSTSDRQRPAVDFIGNNVYVFWFDNRSGKYELYFAKSTDSAGSFAQNQAAYSNSEASINLAGNSFGRISLKTASPNNIFVAFDFLLNKSSPPFSDPEVLFIKSGDGGNTFTAPHRLSDDPANSLTIQRAPSLTLLPDGSPAIAWNDYGTNFAEGKVMFVYSQDKGETFSPNTLINNTPTNYVLSAPTIVADTDGKIHYVRLDAGGIPFGVWYTKIDLGVQFQTTPTPFLDLPWDYKGQKQSFKDAALDIYSFFDHKYPLIFTELPEAKGKIVTYTGVEENDQVKPYSGHNGYDYPLDEGTPVLAAADGTASYLFDVNGGETIVIDHGGSFTWYLHLESKGLIVNQPGQTVNVTKGQQIALSGNTGSNTSGPHLHVSVIRDLDNNHKLDFGTDYPYGLIDPYGWQGDGNNGTLKDDPWPAFGGSKSSYLWVNTIDPTNGQISQSGGDLTSGPAKVSFPEDQTRPNLNLSIYEQPSSNASASLKGVSHTFDIKALDTIGNLVTSFSKAYKLIIDYSNFDLTNIIEDTLSIYWFNPVSQNWEKVPTDLSNKTASAELNHASLFVLMGQAKDLTPPVTTINLGGTLGKDNWFRSDVILTLSATDNQDGVGVKQTYFSINNETDWQLYNNPLTFTQDGEYTIFAYSIDKGRNIETPHSLTFHIDKISPEAKVFIDQDKQDLVVVGIDANQTIVTKTNNPATKKKDDAIYTISDLAGNTLKIDVRDWDKEKHDKFRVFSVQYNNNASIKEPENHFSVSFQKKQGKSIINEQNLEIESKVEIKIKYDQKKNLSTISVERPGHKEVKEIKTGLVLLQLTTNKGNIEYSY
ncbi:MAG: peptidoglycan DD-metalloendopeptidase family protein [Candidatus Curtissbacteria bacterium]